jgi:arsenical pump membrane protein
LEALWVSIGAALLILLQLISLKRAVLAVRMGVDVYLFLTGMMLLAELARHAGVFDWIADIATQLARGSSARLFLLVYVVGVVVTAFLSNDATAVVLTPAVLAAARRAEVEPRPHLLACAFIANAASFVFPISNPANLVVYRSHLPALFDWLRTFWLASLISIASTFVCLRWLPRGSLKSPVPNHRVRIHLTLEGRLALAGLLFGAAILLTASAKGFPLGLPTCLAALLALFLISLRNRRALVEVGKGVSWSVLPLVAGLFVIVEALNGAGLLEAARLGLASLSMAPAWLARFGSGLSVSLLSNLMNNLPVGLASGAALQQNGAYGPLAHAVLLGVDLGPNLSVTGSLATILWLIALRREHIEITAWQFLEVGMIVMPVTLLLTILGCQH